jgi:hypothetical protein
VVYSSSIVLGPLLLSQEVIGTISRVPTKGNDTRVGVGLVNPESVERAKRIILVPSAARQSHHRVCCVCASFHHTSDFRKSR